MKKILLPVLFLLGGLGAGIGAGILFAPSSEVSVETANEAEAADVENESAVGGETAEDEKETEPQQEGEDTATEFLNMTNQFIVPLVNEGEVAGLVVLSLSLEVSEGTIAQVHQLEPKVRDRFLQVLFNHANNGGFSGNFTDFRYTQSLKDELLRNAKVVAGKNVVDVLILDLVRQDPQ